MLEEKIAEWLRGTGFPLEMDAATAFREAGFEIRQSSVVLDPQENKSREIDVLAEDPDLAGIIEIACVLECKSSKNPWVIFTSEDTLANYSRLFAFGMLSSDALSAASKRWNKSAALRQFLARPSQCGYAFRQAFGNDKDPAYVAAMAVLKACHTISQGDAPSNLPHLKFTFPIIVIDSPLFECSKGVDGELSLTQVTHGDFLFSSYVPERTACCIKVLTKAELPRFARYFRELATAIRTEFSDIESNAFKET